jgi:hypothetical protein
MNKLLREMEFLAKNEVRIGVLAGTTDSDSESNRSKAGDVKAQDFVETFGPGGSRTRSNVTQVEVFAVHELGLGVPKRDSLSWVMDHERQAINTIAQRVSALVMAGKLTGQQALGLTGELIISLVQRRIRERIPPPLDDATVERKTRLDGKTADIPLIFLGQFIRSFRWNVVGSLSGR